MNITLSNSTMDDSQNKACLSKAESELNEQPLSDLSPVTNLAVNLSCLSTSAAGTPIRRISWSNSVPGGRSSGISLKDISPSNDDSPTFQDVFMPRGKSKNKMRRSIRKMLTPTSDDDKENQVPNPKARIQFSPDECDLGYSINDSQDSGYSATITTSSTKVRSSIFGFDEDDSIDSIFQLEEMEEQDIVAVPDNMSSLLTKPLIEDSSHLARTAKKGKLPIRRCLSMEMERASESSHQGSMTNSEIDAYVTLNRNSPDLGPKEKGAFKRPDPPGNLLFSQNKRRKSSPNVEASFSTSVRDNFVLKRSYSETATTIMHALQVADSQPELIGDGSRSYALPLVNGRHQDLKSISGDTLARLIAGQYKEKLDDYVLVDCRYPYEYDAGHIQGALNIYTKEDILDTFFKKPTSFDTATAIIFHCEFSSERAPNLCRFLRNSDREANEGNYPHLHHPEIYILEGGYKSFFHDHKELCQPQGYKPMAHKDHGFEMRHFRAKSKSWGAEYKSRTKLRSNSKPVNI